jgi:Ser/Thr protein kinase RdoA (MazF antagonist)
VRDQLIDRLRQLLGELPQRGALMTTGTGPETLLHGDLFTSNIVVSPDASRAQLIDWDHVGVGPFTYDLSTLLLRFPPSARPGMVARYQAAMNGAGWRLPSPRELNNLFETAECARYANRIIWSAVALRVDGAEWALAELRRILQWFQALTPVLPM